MEKSINIIIPYFGTFPNYFQLFLNSCEHNSTVNWTIVTDNQVQYQYPSNVQLVQMSFTSLHQRIQDKFDFPISLDNIHKLCEYKPAYGYIFDDYVKGYDYWGYGDLDLIYGDMRHFLTPEILQYHKIFTLGHLTLIQNEKQYNEMFMKTIQGKQLYKEAFSSPDNFNFDESFQGKLNINSIFANYNCTIWDKSFAADIYTKSSDFRLDNGDGTPENKKKAFFLWNKGNLYRYIQTKGGIERQDYLYIHLQKRKMKICIPEFCDVYKIIPNEFSALEISASEMNAKYSKIKIKNRNMQYFKIRFRNLITKLKSRYR